MEQSLPIWLVQLIGMMLGLLVFFALLDIMKKLDRIADRLKEANEANPNIAHKRYLNNLVP